MFLFRNTHYTLLYILLHAPYKTNKNIIQFFFILLAIILLKNHKKCIRIYWSLRVNYFLIAFNVFYKTYKDLTRTRNEKITLNTFHSRWCIAYMYIYSCINFALHKKFSWRSVYSKWKSGELNSTWHQLIPIARITIE